jgi:hypothetical protein
VVSPAPEASPSGISTVSEHRWATVAGDELTGVLYSLNQ